MEISVVDLRYRMKSVLGALERNEEVVVLYHGKPKGVIRPNRSGVDGKVAQHPFFGMSRSRESVASVMKRLRKERYGAL